MKYSFVLPAYKAKFFKESIDSILAQTYPDFELIIVNDASPEDLDSIVASYDDPRIKYFKNKENIGGNNLVSQWNYCITLCKSDYLILSSDDDVYDPDYLFKLNKLVDKYPQVNVFRPRVRYIDSDNKITDIGGYLKEFCTDLEWLEAWVKGWIGSGIPYYIIKREALLEIGGFADYPLGWFADDATILRLLHKGIVSSSDFLFSFRVSGISISSRRNSSQDLKNKIIASERYYNEVINYLHNINDSDHYSRCLNDSIMKWLPQFMQNAKIRTELFNASFISVTSHLKQLMNLSFMSKKRVFYLYVNYLFNFFTLNNN